MSYTYRYEAREIDGVWYVVQLPYAAGDAEVKVCMAISQQVAHDTAMRLMARRLAA